MVSSLELIEPQTMPLHFSLCDATVRRLMMYRSAGLCAEHDVDVSRVAVVAVSGVGVVFASLLACRLRG